MRKIIAGMFITLDGVVEAPEKWNPPYYDDELNQDVMPLLAAAGTHLYGRRSYELFRGVFTGPAAPPHAGLMTATPKVVVSTTLTNPDWGPTRMISSNITAAVTELKQQPGQDISVGASATLVRFLLAEHLLDELRLLVHPVVAGTGKRLFAETGSRVPLTLLESRPHRNGVMTLRYAPAEAAAKVPQYQAVADAIFEEPRLAEIYDELDPDRSDVDAYAAMAAEFGAENVLDVGCGTGTLACLLAGRGLAVIAVDPSAACLEVARRKPGAGDVRWVHGNVTALPPLQVDLVTMTANVAQVFVTGQEWAETLAAVHGALRPGGRLVFESRDPARKAWLEWSRDHTYRRVALPGAGPVETWIDLTDVQGSLVSFRTSFVFGRDGAMLTSGSTLRFRSRGELTGSLAAAALTVEEIRDTPDRPGREFVYIARRDEEA